MISKKIDIIKKIRQYAEQNGFTFFYGNDNEFNLLLNSETEFDTKYFFVRDDTGSSIGLNQFGGVREGVISFVFYLAKSSDFTKLKMNDDINGTPDKLGRFETNVSPMRVEVDNFLIWLQKKCVNIINYINVTDFYDEFDFNLDGVKVRLNVELNDMQI